MGTLEDRNRDSAKRDDPKDKDRQGVPRREGEGSSDKYSREGQGKPSRPAGEESDPGASRRGPGSEEDRSSDMEDRS